MTKDIQEPQARSARPWWQTGTIYQIYPFSFQDSNSDGVGDLPGILGRLDYVKDLGVDAVWLSPIYPSPMHDNGYDVADYRRIAPVFGTMEDFDRLLEEIHRRGLKLILDLVPNHTSDEHPWFQESRSSRDNPRRDWYIWRDPGPQGGVPNNWLSYFGGPAWTYDEATGQYYLHQFDTHQPELNYRHPAVLPAMLDNLRFWLDKGVDGFRVDVFSLLLKDPLFRDEPPNPAWNGLNPHRSLLHVHTQDVEGIHDVVRRFRAVLDEYRDRFMVGEIYLPFERLVRYYGQDDEVHLPFNFHLLRAPWEAKAIRRLIEQYEAVLPNGAWPNWVNGNHDRPRTASRVGPDQARLANMLLLTLRGTPTVYYGEELGLENASIPASRARDPMAFHLPAEEAAALARDRCRAPMPWDDSPQAGFTQSTDGPWLPLGPDSTTRNVGRQESDPSSDLNHFRRLTRLRRRSPALNQGAYASVATPESEEVLAYRRWTDEEAFLICLNIGQTPVRLDLSRQGASARYEASTRMDRQGQVRLAQVDLRPHEGLVLQMEGDADV